MSSTDRFTPEKREIALVDRNIMKRTEQVFPEEIRLILASTNLMRRITRISKDAAKEFSTNPFSQPS